MNQQLALATSILRHVTGRYADSPVVLHGEVTSPELKALAAVHVSDVVYPSHPSPARRHPHSNGVRHFACPHSPTHILATDGPLDELINDRAINAGRRAVLTLNTLAFLHFEAPNAPHSRSVTVEISPARTTAAFINDLLGAINNEPVHCRLEPHAII